MNMPQKIGRRGILVLSGLSLLPLLCLLAWPFIKVLSSPAADEREFRYGLMMREVGSVERGESHGLTFYDVWDHGDRVLLNLEPLEGLESIRSRHTMFTAEGIAALRIQPNLKNVRFEQIDDAAIEAIAQLPQIEIVSILRSPISDKSVSRIAQLPNLQYLRLQFDDDNAQQALITDKALESLATCKSLQELRINGHWFSREAVERLQQALPDCEIDTGQFD